jgi:hypothetical protein
MLIFAATMIAQAPRAIYMPSLLMLPSYVVFLNYVLPDPRRNIFGCQYEQVDRVSLLANRALGACTSFGVSQERAQTHVMALMAAC